MIKKLSLLVLALAFCLSIASPKLRTEIIFRPSQLISVLSEQVSSLNIGSTGLASASESEYLNEFAQALAEHNGNAIDFIDSYEKSKYTDAILTFGFKLKGNTKINTLLFNDSTGIFFVFKVVQLN